MSESGRTKALGIICALLGGILWGFSGSCAQYVFSSYGVDTVWLASVRIAIAGASMFAIAVILRGKRLLAPVKNPRDLLQIVLFAVFGLLFTQFTYLMAINYSNASTATVLEYIGPVLVVIVVCIGSHRAPRPLEVVSVICVVMGTFFLATHGDPTQLVLTPEALIWGLLAATSMIFYTLIPESLLARYDNVSVLAWAMVIGAIVMAAIAQPWASMPTLDLTAWLMIIVGLALLGSVAAFFFYFNAIKLIGPAPTSMLASIEVLSATCFAVIWLGTSFTGMDLLGLLFILSTVFLLSRDN